MANTDFRDYRKMICRFPNEGGFLGPASLPTMKACLVPGQEHVQSFAWQVHDNSVDSWFEPSAPDQTLMQWLGKDPRGMTIEEFTYWSGLLHGEALREYCDNFHRRMFDSSSAIFWMYNDCWPTSSWTVHDSFVRRKPLFYHMKRAFAPVGVSMRETDGGVEFFVANRTGKPFRGRLRFGRYRFRNGDTVVEYEKEVSADAMSSVRAGFFHTTMAWPWETIRSFVYATLENEQGKPVGNVRHWFTSVKGMTLEEFPFPRKYWEHDTLTVPKIEIQRPAPERLIVTTDVPAFGIRLNIDEFLPDDNCFDLLPSETKTLTLARPLPEEFVPDVLTQNQIISFLRGRAG